MAIIIASDMKGSGQKAITETTLGASDTFVFNPETNPILIFDNITAGALTPLLVGDAAAPIGVPGFGNVDASTGELLTSVGIGDVVGIALNTISTKLLGTVTVTGGDGIVAQLLEF